MEDREKMADLLRRLLERDSTQWDIRAFGAVLTQPINGTRTSPVYIGFAKRPEEKT